MKVQELTLLRERPRVRERRNSVQILKCAVCTTWAESKGLALLSIFFCKNKNHSSSRAPLSNLKVKLEKYIGKLGTTVVDSKIRFSVNYFKKTRRPRTRKPRESNQIKITLEEAPTFNSQTGAQMTIMPEAVDPEISENSIYILQNIKLGSLKVWCSLILEKILI